MILFMIMAMVAYSAKSRVPDSTALILIDIQEFYFPGGSIPLVQPGQASENAAALLAYFREQQMLIVHVGHEAKTGAGFHSLVKPRSGEKVFMKKEVNAFLDTGLDGFLKENGIGTLVFCGMQTHMCLEGAVRAAHDLGYACTVVADACATRDLAYGGKTVKAADVQASTLATLKSYARVTTSGEITK